MPVRTIILLSTALLLAGCGTFGRDDGEAAPAELTEFTPSINIERLWSTNTGRGMSASQPNLRPYHEGGRLWVGDHRGRVVAVNADSGRIERSFSTELEISAGPAVQEGLVMIGTFDGKLVVLDADDGSELWSAQLSSEVLSYPVLHDDIIIVRCIDGRVFGFDARNGRRLWVHDRSVPLLTLRGTGDPLVRADQVFIGYDDGMVSALKVSDGSVLWEQRVSQPEGRTELERIADIDGPMAIVGTELYVVTYRGRLAGLALESGRIMWVKEVASHSGLSLSRIQLAAADREDSVWLVDRRNGATLWRDESLARRQLTRPVFYGNELVVVDADGYMHFYDTDSGEFAARTRATRKAPASAPVVVGNTLFLLDENGMLSAWRAGPDS